MGKGDPNYPSMQNLKIQSYIYPKEQCFTLQKIGVIIARFDFYLLTRYFAKNEERNGGIQ